MTDDQTCDTPESPLGEEFFGDFDESGITWQLPEDTTMTANQIIFTFRSISDAFEASPHYEGSHYNVDCGEDLGFQVTELEGRERTFDVSAEEDGTILFVERIP